MPDCSKLTETTFHRIVECIRKGGTYRLAARRACIGYRTLLRWFRHGRRNEDEGCKALLAAVNEAQSERAEQYLETINTQCESDGKLALEMLARLYPREYGSDRQRMQHIERRLAQLEKEKGKPDA
jgi:hypothetical protein